MKTLLVMTFIFGSIVLALAAVAGVIYLFVRILQGGVGREARRIQSEEAKIIQDVYQGLAKMEKRVQALETILLDRERERNRKEGREP